MNTPNATPNNVIPLPTAAKPCTRRLSCPCAACQDVRGVVDFLIDAPEAFERPMAERRTTHGAVMSPRMARFHRFLDDRKIPIGDWSTDVQVLRCRPQLEAALDVLTARLGGMDPGVSRRYLEELRTDIAGIMNRVPANRSSSGQLTREQREAMAERRKIEEKAAAAAAKLEAERKRMLIAVDLPSEQTGAVVWWEGLAGRTVDEIVAALRAASVDESMFPRTPSDDKIFTRAVRTLRARDVVIRQHPKGGYYLLLERIVDGEPDPQVGARFQLVDGEVRGPEGDPQLDQVRDAFATAKGTLTATDVSEWLIASVGRIGGVTLKADAGHFYFMPRAAIGTYKAVKGALAGLHAGDLREIPAMRAAEGVASVLASVADEVKTWTEKAEGDMTAEKIGGPRACATRAAEGIALSAKVKTYEALLGTSMQPALDRIAAVVKAVQAHTTRGAMLEVD